VEPEPDFQLFSSLRFDRSLLESTANSALEGSPVPFYMLSYHRDRMLQAATHFGWEEAADSIAEHDGLGRLVRALKKAIDIESDQPLRVRTLLSHSGEIAVETNPVPPLPLESLYPSRIPEPAPPLRTSALTGGALTLGPGDTIQSGGPGHGDPRQDQCWTILVDPQPTKPSPFTTYKTTSRDMYTTARERVGITGMTDPKEVLIISESGEIMEGSLTSCYFWRVGRWVTPPVSSGGQAGTTRRWLLQKGLCEEAVVGRDSLVDGEECWVSNGVRGMIWGKIKL
jgi:4-amino-4-deoxychorismate lyase